MALNENNNEREMRLTTKTKLRKQRRKRHVSKTFSCKKSKFCIHSHQQENHRQSI
jgi:hypothetical protein